MKVAGPAALVVLVALVATPASPAVPAYVPNTIDFLGGAAVVAHWPTDAFPIATRVTRGLTNDVPAAAGRAALDAAMATWSDSPDSIVEIFVEAEQRGLEANVVDGINAIEFSNDAALDNAQFLTLSFTLMNADGSIVESDLLVNDRAIGFTTIAGSGVGLDLETTMLQEVGRFLGLASSPLGGFGPDGTLSDDTSVMFPVGRGVGDTARTLRDDDVAALAALYPAPDSARATITGQVVRAGTGLFGAHVVAHEPVQDILVGAVSLPDGTFRIGGLSPGTYLLVAFPLNDVVSPAALGGIFLRDGIDTTFRAAAVAQAIRVGAGQTATGVLVRVQ